MARSARRENRGTERHCAVSRQRKPLDELLRFAVDPDGRAVPDLKARLPGRGVWLTCARDVVEKAAAGGVFDRAFRRPVKTAESLGDLVDSLLERDALQRLSLANKAGLVVCGFDKVMKVLRSGDQAILLHAGEASRDGRRKLDRLARSGAGGTQPAAAVLCNFNAEQMSLALGRPNVVHAALKQGGPRGKFLDAVARLERFRAGGAVDAAA